MVVVKAWNTSDAIVDILDVSLIDYMCDYDFLIVTFDMKCINSIPL